MQERTKQLNSQKKLAKENRMHPAAATCLHAGPSHETILQHMQSREIWTEHLLKRSCVHT